MRRLDDQDVTLTRWRATHGLCISCGQPALPGQTLCGKCAGVEGVSKSVSQKYVDEARLRSARTRAKRAASGLCSRCGRRPPANGHVLCEACLSSMTTANSRRRERAALSAAVDICTVCHHRQARPGRRTCGECAEAAAARRRELRARRVEAKLCTECGKPVKDGKMCAACRAKKAETQRVWREKRHKKEDE